MLAFGVLHKDHKEIGWLSENLSSYCPKCRKKTCRCVNVDKDARVVVGIVVDIAVGIGIGIGIGTVVDIGIVEL